MNIKTGEVAVRGRKRPVDKAKVADLAASINEIGLLNSITVRESPPGSYVLVAGLHRLEAFKLLGRESIPAEVFVGSDLEAELAEIDENLRRYDLTVLEQGELLLRRNEILAERGERRTVGRHPDSNGETVSPLKTTPDVASEIGLSERAAQQRMQIARDIAPDVKESIRNTPLAESTTGLLRIARMTPEEQRKAVDAKTTAQLMSSSESNEWYTPEDYTEAARKVMGGVDLDPASCPLANETVKAKMFYTSETNGLTHEWKGRVWLNPPWGSLTAQFVSRLIEQHDKGMTKEAILLANAHATDTDWFQPLWNHTLCFTDHRINYKSPSGTGSGSTHGSVFVYIGQNAERFAKEFTKFGTIVKRWPK